MTSKISTTNLDSHRLNSQSLMISKCAGQSLGFSFLLYSLHSFQTLTAQFVLFCVLAGMALFLRLCNSSSLTGLAKRSEVLREVQCRRLRTTWIFLMQSDPLQLQYGTILCAITKTNYRKSPHARCGKLGMLEQTLGKLKKLVNFPVIITTSTRHQWYIFSRSLGSPLSTAGLSPQY